MSRKLKAWFDNSTVGELIEEDDIWSFVYDESWNNKDWNISLSPALDKSLGVIKDGSSKRPVQWFFDNLLPEEVSRDILSREANVNVADSFGLLEYYGAESAGSITLLGADAKYEEDINTKSLTYQELSERIQNLPTMSLANDAPKKMSLAGAQHKLAVNYIESKKEIVEPSERGISTHILKPDHPQKEFYHHTTVNEWFVMRLARKVGLDVPDVNLLFVPEPVYIVKRFDRQYDLQGRIEKRKHIIDGCQLLGISRSSKYTQADVQHLETLVSFCRKKALARERTYRWAIFNVLVGNSDAHLKNLSFFVIPQGIELSPFYDLLSTSIYGPNSPLDDELSYSMGEARFFRDISRKDVIDFGESLNISSKASEKYLDDVIERTGAEFDALYKEYESETFPDAPGLYKQGALKMLREIKYNVMQEMSNKLV